MTETTNQTTTHTTTTPAAAPSLTREPATAGPCGSRFAPI